jgi:hypothetical protein
MRPFYRFHSLTVIIMLLAIGPLLRLNMNPPTDWKKELVNNQREAPENLNPITRAMFYKGCPVSPCQFCVFHGMKWHPEESHLVDLPLLINLCVLVVVGLFTGILAEWCIRRIKAR